MKTWSRTLTENASYKLVALVVATVLWLTMQGRRDTVLSREVELQVLLAPNLAITNPIPQVIKLEVSGPRVALRKLAERVEPVTVDLRRAQPGRRVVALSRDNLSLPLGAKVVSLQPNEFLAVIVEMESKREGIGHVEK